MLCAGYRGIAHRTINAIFLVPQMEKVEIVAIEAHSDAEHFVGYRRIKQERGRSALSALSALEPAHRSRYATLVAA